MEPTVEALSGSSIPRVVKRYALAMRPMFLSASTLPLLLGTVWGWKAAGDLDPIALLLAAVAVVCVHGGANVLNDVYDDQNGADVGNAGRIYPYTGGSRMIQNEILSRARMHSWGTALIGVAIVLGVVLLATKGPVVLAFGLLGIALGTLYSVPPVQLAMRGLGELAVGLGFGVLPVTGAAWLQSGQIGPGSLLVAVPVSCWVTNILVMNEIPDARADAAAGKRTLVVRMGRSGTAVLYAALSIAAFTAVGGLVAMGLLPRWALAVPATLLGLGLGVAWGIGNGPTTDHGVGREIQLTLAVHGLGTIWLAASVWAFGAP